MLLIFNYGIIPIPKTRLFPKSGRWKNIFPLILNIPTPLTFACLSLYIFPLFLCHLDLRLKRAVHQNSCKRHPTHHLQFCVLRPTDKTSPHQSVLSRGRTANSLPIWLSFTYVWFSTGQIRGGRRLWRTVGSLYKHVGDVLAKVDFTVSCYGLVLHQLQVLWG